MFSFATICPHPPIILPTIGREEDLRKVRKTIEAMEKLREKLEKIKPESLILISPHGPVGFKDMGLVRTEELFGTLSIFGDFTSKFFFKNDKKLCKKIEVECEKKNIPLRIYEKIELDHGMLVPLYYLTKNQKPKIVPLANSLLDNSWHYIFGKVLGKIARENDKKMGIVTSGDLSHRLSPGAPAGYSPRGKEFDEILVKFLKGRKIEEILNMDENLIEEAGECGLKPIIILLGALSELENWEFEILSYEGPFGVGYLVADVEGL